MTPRKRRKLDAQLRQMTGLQLENMERSWRALEAHSQRKAAESGAKDNAAQAELRRRAERKAISGVGIEAIK